LFVTVHVLFPHRSLCRSQSPKQHKRSV
jgi:hypothetical protein